MNEIPAKPPREFWIVGPDNDEPSVHHINPGFNDQVHVIEYSAYSQLAEQLERYKGMWESECARGNRHLDKFMQSERALEQVRKERDEFERSFFHANKNLREAWADLDRHKRAVERAKEMLGTITAEDIGPQLIAEITRILEGKE